MPTQEMLDAFYEYIAKEIYLERMKEKDNG